MSNTMLPPPGSETYEIPAIPIYEEHSGSLRPTWLPVDPTTFPPPAPKRRGARLAKFAKRTAQIGALLMTTFAIAFGGVVGSHAAHEFVLKRAAASAAPAVVIAPTVAREPVVASSTSDVASASKTADSGVILTVDVNDLPVSKDPRSGKAHGARGHRAAGS